MAYHEFGIMPEVPRPGQRYDEYQPEAYARIRVPEDCLAPSWHTPPLAAIVTPSTSRCGG